MRKPLVAGNWKMHKTASEATRLFQQLSNSYDQSLAGVDMVVCPPFTSLRSAQVTLEFDSNTEIKIGAQDVHWEPQGAFTGAISAAMLKDVSCTYCIVGHSERRGYFGETDEMVALKAAALAQVGIVPIVCCGESLETREEGGALSFVTAQIRAALENISAEDAKAIVIAYEPIWAIGTGRTALPEQAEEVCNALRETLQELYGKEVADAIRILYGGSLNPGNVESFVAMPNIDGGLVGGASLVAEDFIVLLKAFS
ncbi:MAG: triose-phosphate isomerase [Coriobacteriia bacterium]|nr:triose-phosphate isomerase [Coriobacteriia bacterium]